MVHQDASRHFDTIIIGAGISGLACASKLSEYPSYQEDKRFAVLEARNRVGGRIESVVVDGNRLDTGANWIHGVGTKDKPNPLMEILPEKRVKELACSVNFKAVETTTNAANDAGKDLVIPPRVSSQILGSIWELIGSLHERAVSNDSEENKNTSLLQTIENDEDFKKAFLEIPDEYHHTLSSLPQFVEDMEAGPLNANSARNDGGHSRLGLLEFAIDDFDGEQVFLRDGYSAVVEEVGRNVMENDQVKLGVEVQQISWGTNPIVIKTSDGPYTAQKVVSTIPLGVLKDHIESSMSSKSNESFFEPPLPRQKVEAISSLGFGTLNKIFLVYSSPWWTTEPYYSIFQKGLTKMKFSETPDRSSVNSLEPDSIWGFTTELPGLSISPSGTTLGPRLLSLMNLHSLTGIPALSAFVSCSNATYIESLSNHDAGMIVHRALTEWLGREPPLPNAVHVTRWARDQYSRGSYTHMIKGLSETNHREEFEKPIINDHGAELRFAGEHTSVNHFATVHGALLSGWREAKAILDSES